MVKKKHVHLLIISWLLILFLFICTSNATVHAESPNGSRTSLQADFQKAADIYHVPVSILMSVSYNETRWESHNGQPSTSGGYGVMHLTDSDSSVDLLAKGDVLNKSASAKSSDQGTHTLAQAAKLINAPPQLLKKDTKTNILGGAALLADYQKQLTGTHSSDPEDWYGAVAKYSGSADYDTATDFADQVYKTIKEGAVRTFSSGGTVRLQAKNVKPDKTSLPHLQLPKHKHGNADEPKGVDMQNIPALYEAFSDTDGDYGNYDLANRPYDGQKIRYIIIHDSEVSYEGTINTFLQKSYVSSHYVIRSSDGQITKMVDPKDVAWHAGNWYINSHSIGIEHEGYAVEGSTWYSEPMYRASAKLVKYLAKKYDIPLDREHIIGHEEVPGLNPARQVSMHWDPAAYWNWTHYFDLLGAPFSKKRNSIGLKKSQGIVTINPNYKTNKPETSYNNQPLEPKPSNFVYLYTEPSFNAPLISDPLLHPNGSGTTALNDWGDKAVAGRSYYKVAQTKNWTAIDFGGQKAWFYNPKSMNTVPGSGILITAKKGAESIPVYGSAYPEASAYDQFGIPAVGITPIYSMPAGQIYVGEKVTGSDYYYAKLFNKPETYHVVSGQDQYYQISYNHRIAFVKKSDVLILHPFFH
ncbi:N-acetylmuramoyl-L-alanine amidase [Sporolactobacillus shoreicorticis]|uniref:N-acetylmuramoyl-L-alanine amidase n=1 Tax=Sporolactobacillus shoreicorticis TaxID=1923877 RepID=A0ABW5S3Y6_9BACL|nr:N-acetylmuramoyl-L-alanine amidase [Sporolactobacillus shoreicorticis]MCO7127545.1 N-acetylmuramoyl-L-alanine amidase [Sporolactobacillus shoreicorticis]